MPVKPKTTIVISVDVDTELWDFLQDARYESADYSVRIEDMVKLAFPAADRGKLRVRSTVGGS